MSEVTGRTVGELRKGYVPFIIDLDPPGVALDLDAEGAFQLGKPVSGGLIDISLAIYHFHRTDAAGS